MNEPLGRIRGGVHAAVSHDSALAHVTGAARYLDDVPSVPGTLEAALVLSPHAHARIRHVDLARARAAPGVVAAITAADIPGKNDIAPIRSDEPALADGVVEYEGQPVAAIAAATFDQARAAAKLADIAYEPLPAVLTIEEAMARESYVSPPQLMVRGEVEPALASAPHRLSGELRCGGQDHFYLEGQIAVATPGEGSDMQVFSSTQHPTEVQHGVAHLLGLPFNAVTVEVRRMGGAFGGKESQATIIAGIAAVLARKARRPVKLRLPRDDDMRATGKRHPFLIRYDVGFDGEGRILALDLTLAANGGNVADHTPAVLTRALCHADNCYFLPNVRLRGLPCKTNTVSNTAFRGYGGPQGMLAIETIIEVVARRLGLPVHAVRRRNFYGIGRNDVTPYGMTVEDNIIERVVDELDRAVDLAAWRREVVNFNRQSPVIKKGLATMPVKFGISFNRPALNQAGALVHVYTDGSVVLNHGGTEMGQGLFIKVAQVVAEAFAIDLDHIRVSATSTAKVPNTSPTAASSGSDLNGMAALDACRQIKARMTEVAADHFGAPAGEIVFDSNRVYCGNRSVSFAELAALSWEKRVSLSAAGFYRTPKIHWDFASNTRPAVLLFRLWRRRRRGRDRYADRRVARAARRARPGLRPLAQSGDRSRPDRGRVRPGHGLAHHRRTVVGRRRPPAHLRPVDLQDPRQPRRAAGLQCPPARRCPEPRSHDLPLQGHRRAAADAGHLCLARNKRRHREPRRPSRRSAARRAGDAGARADGDRGAAPARGALKRPGDRRV